MARRRKARFRPDKLLNDSAEPVFVLDPERVVVYFNRACEELTGWPSDRALGLQCRFHGPVAADLSDLGASLSPPPMAMAGETCSVTSLFLRRGGERLWRDIHFFPCRDCDGGLLGVVGIITSAKNSTAAPTDPTLELHEQLLRLRELVTSRYGLEKIVAVSPPMCRVLEQARLASQIDTPVLLLGERGSGKSLIARSIHMASGRHEGVFLPVDCAAAPPDVLEADLFGTSKEFTVRRREKQGLVRGATSGTLYLKNLSKLPRDLQARLVEQLGRNASDSSRGPAHEASKSRLIASDTVAPEQALASDLLRRDLFFLVSTLLISVPPLRERREDLPLLAQTFLEAANRRGDKQLSGLSPDALKLLLEYAWTGGVPELIRVIEQAHATCEIQMIEARHVTPCIQGSWGGIHVQPAESEAPVDLDAILLGTERRLIQHALQKSRGNKSQAAELLSISRPRLYRRMVELGMDVEQAGELQSSASELGGSPKEALDAIRLPVPEQ